MRRVLLILTPPLLVLLALIAGLRYWAVPKMEAWALGKMTSYSEKHLPVVIRADSVHLHLFKPSLSVEKISIVTKGDLQAYTEKVEIESVRCYLDFFQLLSGHLQISAILVDSPKTKLELDPLLNMPSSKPEPLPLNLVFEWSEKIPVERIFIHNVDLNVESVQQKSHLEIESADLLLNNHQTTLSARFDAPKAQAWLQDQGPLQTRMDFGVSLSRESLKIIRAGLRFESSEVALKGEMDEFQKVTLHPKGHLELEANINAQELMPQIRQMLPSYKIPSVQGQAIAKGDLQIDGIDKIGGKLDLQTKDMGIDKFSLGNASLHGTFKGRSLNFHEVEVHHPSGTAKLVDATLELEDNLNFKTKVQLESLDLQKLFQSIDLQRIPVWAQFKGEANCTGALKKPLKVDCEGAVDGSDITVTAGYEKKATTILKLDKISAKASAELTEQGVTYKGDLVSGATTGQSDGSIDFRKGFNINYKTPKLNFSDIRDLANLRFKGSAAVEGSTSGNATSAAFDMKVKAQDFSFEDYYLGQVGASLNYKKGHLGINDISGLLPKSTYNGSLDVDFINSRIVGHVKAPTLELADLVTVFQAHYLFPVSVKAVGTADVTFSGPLEFWKMSYQLDSRFKGGLLAGESFDELVLNAQASQGQMQIQKATLRKGNSLITAIGGISATQDLNLKIDGRGFRLDESDYINHLSTNIFGIFNFTSQIHGKVTEPEVSMRGSVTETVLDEQEIPSSFFEFKARKNGMEGNANIFGHRIQADWLLPFNNSPLRLRLKTVDWNYAFLLSILSGNVFQNEYDSSLTTDVDLKSDNGSWQKMSGNISVKNLYLKRGGLSFRNPDPITIRMDEGRIHINNFNLEGPQNSIQVKGQNFTFNNMNVNIVANTELRLFHMLLPFLDDLGGSLQAAATITGSINQPQIIGTVSTGNSFVKIKDFPHPIEHIQTEVNFSQSKIIISNLKAQMAGGIVTADGNLLLNGSHDIPTSIRINLDSVNLNLPDKVKTSGSADLLLSGKWFPFLLSGTYRIEHGVFEKEFTDESKGGVASVRQSVYLPKVLRESTFEPLILDIQILLEKNLLVKNSLVDGAVAGNLQVKGPLSNPIILGHLQTEKNTKLMFKDKVFEVQTGTIQFNNPNEINPDLYILAQSRVDVYDVTLLIQGPAKDSRIFHLTSVPPLGEQDIVSLLALGVTNTHMDQSVQTRDQAAQTGYEVGFAVLAQPINKGLQNTLGVNVQFTSSYDSTLNISVPKVTLSKKLMNNVNASATRTIGSDVNDSVVKIQYLINSNVSAIGSYEDRDYSQLQGVLANTVNTREQKFFGLDLEYKKGFK